jgi:(2Fe-2S) ferredoxin
MGKDLQRVEKTLYLCAGGPCVQKGAESLIRETRALLRMEGAYGWTHTVKTHCAGQCEHGPVFAVQPDNTWYRNLDSEKCGRIIREHILEGTPVQDLLLHPEGGIPERDSASGTSLQIPFEVKTAEGWGEAKVAAMPAWEMNLHPLLRDLFVVRYAGLVFTVPGRNPFKLDRPASFAYDGIEATLGIDVGSSRETLTMIIGLFKDNHPDHPRLWRNRITEVAFLEKADDSDRITNRVLLITSRSGERALEVRFPNPAEASEPWEHFTRIYLERP